MIAGYFGMREDPFGTTPDPRLLYASRTHREALASLRYSFLAHRGFAALIAEPGMGKTTLLFKFMELVQKSAHTAFLFNTRLQPDQLVTSLLREIGITPGPSIVEMQEQLYSAVTSDAREGRPLIVLLDEAQCLPEETLETVRLLTNFETTRTKLLQVVLAGQPQLSEVLSRPSLLQLRQRIGNISTLERLSHAETCDYIQHRLKAVGYEGDSIFSDEALGRIAAASAGVPRVINTLCFQTLSLCRAARRRVVDGAMVSEALRDLQLPGSLIDREGPQATASVHFNTLDLDRELKQSGRKTGWLLGAIAALVVFIGSGFYCASGVRAEKPRPVAKTPAPFPQDLTNQSAHNTPAYVAPREPPVIVTVEAEQTLSGIALSRLGYFNHETLLQIQTLNPEIADPNLIIPGQKIMLPQRTQSISKGSSSTATNERRVQ